MKQALGFDGLLFVSFSLFKNGLAAPEVDIGGCQVADALVVSVVVVVVDECVDLPFQVTGQEVVFQQKPVLYGLIPALDLALCLRVMRCAANMIHAFVLKVICQSGHGKSFICPPLTTFCRWKTKMARTAHFTTFAKDPLGKVARQFDKPAQNQAETPEGGVALGGGEKALVRWATSKWASLPPRQCSTDPREVTRRSVQ